MFNRIYKPLHLNQHGWRKKLRRSWEALSSTMYDFSEVFNSFSLPWQVARDCKRPVELEILYTDSAAVVFADGSGWAKCSGFPRAAVLGLRYKHLPQTAIGEVLLWRSPREDWKASAILLSVCVCCYSHIFHDSFSENTYFRTKTDFQSCEGVSEVSTDAF